MKQNKIAPYQRSIKVQTYDQLDSDMEDAQKTVQRKLNYLAESNRMTVNSRAVRRRAQRSSDGGSDRPNRRGKHSNKKCSQSKLKDDTSTISRQKSGAVQSE